MIWVICALIGIPLARYFNKKYGWSGWRSIGAAAVTVYVAMTLVFFGIDKWADYEIERRMAAIQPTKVVVAAQVKKQETPVPTKKPTKKATSTRKPTPKVTNLAYPSGGKYQMSDKSSRSERDMEWYLKEVSSHARNLSIPEPYEWEIIRFPEKAKASDVEDHYYELLVKDRGFQQTISQADSNNILLMKFKKGERVVTIVFWPADKEQDASAMLFYQNW